MIFLNEEKARDGSGVGIRKMLPVRPEFKTSVTRLADSYRRVRFQGP